MSQLDFLSASPFNFHGLTPGAGDDFLLIVLIMFGSSAVDVRARLSRLNTHTPIGVAAESDHTSQLDRAFPQLETATLSAPPQPQLGRRLVPATSKRTEMGKPPPGKLTPLPGNSIRNRAPDLAGAGRQIGFGELTRSGTINMP